MNFLELKNRKPNQELNSLTSDVSQPKKYLVNWKAGQKKIPVAKHGEAIKWKIKGTSLIYVNRDFK